MRLRLFPFVLLVVLLAACQGQTEKVVLVVTATPEAASTNAATDTSAPVAATATASPTTIPATPTESIPPTLDVRPTATLGQIQVAEEVFEHGRMFWIQPRQQIWVLFDDGQGGGKWTVYDDNFTDEEPESDPSIVAPEGKFQPTRGFGKLWRTIPEIKDSLGFAITPEFGYVSNYEYYPGGQVNAAGTWEIGPGYHILFSLYNEKFQFNEVDGTWKKL
ncbi:MAG: hypothetical protein LCI00_05135 [Chloroflexi bacterium]|nr:hypothetical protein [Chloroflexota bacterium]MCC6896437.1 hypothetical protein [Anaerolineae bacterium]